MSSIRRTPLAFFVALFLTFVVSMLPTRWLGWVGDVSSIVRLPVAPLADLVNSTVHWLRPPVQTHADLDPQVRELVSVLEEQRDNFERLYYAADERVGDLELQLQQLQQVPIETLNTPVTLLRAQITTRHPSQPNGPVQLNRGSRHGVERNAIAVYQGVHLIGRVADVSAVSSSLHPLAHTSSGLIRAAIFPTGEDDITVHEAARVALRAAGDGTFTGDVAREYAVKIGDFVRLFDTVWPASAQAMMIGYVTDVRIKDNQPLRNEVVITPRFTISQIADVTLIIEDHIAHNTHPFIADAEVSQP